MKCGVLAVFWVAIVVAGCGGGGGGVSGSPNVANQVDGLGDAGHAAGTLDVGQTEPTVASNSTSVSDGPEAVAVALSDQSRGLIVWRVSDRAPNGRTLLWSQETGSGGWSSPQPVPQATNASKALGLTLRMNRAGHAALAWRDYPDSAAQPNLFPAKATRFIEGRGWDATPHLVQSPGGFSKIGHVESWDLAMLDDNSITTSLELADPGTAFIGAGVLRTDVSSVQSVAFTSPNQRYSSNVLSTAYAPRPNGYGLFYYLSGLPTNPAQFDLKAQLASVYSGTFVPFDIAKNVFVCDILPFGDAPMVAATTAVIEGVLAAVTSGDGAGNCTKHQLLLYRVYTLGLTSIDVTRLNSPDTSMAGPPLVVVDQAGNALAVWKESSGNSGRDDATNTVRAMWSQSLYGQPWSAPRPLIDNVATLGKVPYYGQVSVAMNRAGKAVAAFTLQDPSGNVVNDAIFASRFTFDAGWGTWQKVANKQAMSAPRVAINEAGEGILAYTALNVPRVNGQAPQSYQAAEQHVYVLRF